MATQHPDNAAAPYWEQDGDGFVSVQEEAEECFRSFSDLNIDEYMWDWEGKYVDEAVVDKLFSAHYQYFRRHELGRDKFLTFRLPNIWQEKGYSLARALMGILTSESFAADLCFHTPPLFEVILPMTEHAKQLIYIQDTFTKLARFKNKLFGDGKSKFDYVEIIPIFEGVDDLAKAGRVLEQYVRLHQQVYKRRPGYLRPFIARSDPSLNAGQVPAVLASKIALSDFAKLEQRLKIKCYPILGAGSLLFRGGLSPQRIGAFCKEYPGVKTVTIQSAFRYDFALPKVKQAIRKLKSHLPQSHAILLDSKERRELMEMIDIFKSYYQRTVEKLATEINKLAESVPRRRERRLHIGLFGYSRKVGKKQMPRAISFSAAFYSLGVPPELIGSGRALKKLTLRQRELLVKYYVNFKSDLLAAGRYLNKENLELLAKRNSAWQEISKDVALIEEYLKGKLGPCEEQDLVYRNFASNAYLLWRQGKNAAPTILEMGKLRQSLG